MTQRSNSSGNNDWLRRLAEHSPDLFYRMSLPSGRYDYVSPAASQIFGHTPEELIASPLLLQDIIHPDWRRSFAKRWDELLEGNGPSTHEYPVVHGRSGDTRWVQQRNLLVRDTKGHPIAVEGIVTDITEHKRAEEELRAERDFADTALNAQEDTFFVFEPEIGKAIRWNRAFREISGYTDDEIETQPAPDSYYSADQLRRAATFIEELLAAGKGKIELTLICKDGRQVPFEYNAAVIRDQHGAPRYVIAIGRDMTERNRADAEVRTHRERLMHFMNSATDSFHLLDSDLCIIEINEAAIAAIRESMPAVSTSKDVAGKSLLEIYPFLRGEGGEERLKEVLVTGKPIAYDDAAAHPQRGTVHMSIKAFPVGKALGVIATDISIRKQAEQERLNLERQIQHAQKLESLGVLAGGIAHDFNNILVSILGHADLALDEMSASAPGREYLEEVVKASRQAADLASQMLAYSGKGRFELRRIDLQALVEEMAHLMQVSISKKAVLKFDFAENLPAIEGDATQVRQVIMNLITNASEAVGDASGIISITTGATYCDGAYLKTGQVAEDLPEGTYVYLEVADTGCGMDSKTRKSLFDPFFTTKFTGRGLGMAAVQGIVRGHHAGIKVYSEPGKGSSIKVLFPAIEDEAGTLVNNSENEAGLDRWLGHGTILLADDEETVRTLARRMLVRLGFQVVTAADGREALAVFQKHRSEVVCVILDLTMPHMDGEECYRELRRMQSNVPVIMSSGYNEQEVTRRFAGKGLRGFIKKPYRLATIRETLHEILGE